MRQTTLLAAILLIALGCTSDDQSSASTADTARGGTVVISVGGDPDGLFPPMLTTTTGKAVTEQIYDHLADLGADLNTVGDAGFSPRLAKSWRWSTGFALDRFQPRSKSAMARRSTCARRGRRLHIRSLQGFSDSVADGTTHCEHRLSHDTRLTDSGVLVREAVAD
jgi:hypothetical protein